MVGAYFTDLQTLLQASARLLPSGAQAWFVVGDSLYASVHVLVAKVLRELAQATCFRLERTVPRDARLAATERTT